MREQRKYLLKGVKSLASLRVDVSLLLLIAPGWVRIDMGGPGADLSIEESIPGVVDTIFRQSGKPGLYFLDYRGKAVRW